MKTKVLIIGMYETVGGIETFLLNYLKHMDTSKIDLYYLSPILYEYNNDVDINNDLKKIEILQEGILDYVKNNVSGNDIDWNIFIEPSKSDIKFLGNLPFFDANYSRLINSSDLIKYLTNPRKFKEDFYLSVWKIGFLKKIFKLQLPYYKVYEKMKK